jgi:predicted nucleic acid-binding protein
MILVDSGVWIDYFRGIRSAETDRLNDLLGNNEAAVGDLMLTEVLQGFTIDREFRQALQIMSLPTLVPIVDRAVAIAAAANYRALRARGITVRKTIDTLIATRCILDGHSLLYADRDFDPFVAHLGLRSVMHER